MTAPTARRAAGWLTAAALAAAAGVVTAQPPGGPDAARRRADALDQQVKAVGADTRQLEGRIAALRAELDRLKEQVAKLPSGPAEGKKAATATAPVEFPPQPAAPVEKAGAAEVEYRLARSGKSDKDTDLAVVCQGGKVYLVDFKSLSAALKQADQEKSPVLDKGGVLKVAGGDYDAKMTVTRIPLGGGRELISEQIELILRDGRPGETLERAKAPGSAFRTRLGDLNPNRNIIQFCVYPGGFDAFRELRKVAWDQNFNEIGWMPVPVGKAISVGGGPATKQ